MAKKLEKKSLALDSLQLNIAALWKERFAAHLRELIYYWQIMSSAGLLFTVVILFILAIVYYEDFLVWLPEWVPLPFLFSLVLSLVITRTKHRTLIKEADILFLTPQEEQMEHYFQKASRYNIVVQGLAVAAILIILLPIYTHKLPLYSNLFFYFLLPIFLKAWNVQSSWNALRLQDQAKRLLHTGGRFLFNFLLLYWFFTGGRLGLEQLESPILIMFSILMLLIVYAPIAVIFYVLERRWKGKHALHWLAILDIEQGLQTRFYRFANSFVDVPYYHAKVKRRGWLMFLTKALPFHSNSTYRYLYLKTWLRSNEYLGIYVRLTLIGALIVYLLPNEWGKGTAYVILLFVTMMQTKALWGHHQRQFWISLYPVPPVQHKEAFSWFLTLLISIQVISVSLPILFIARQFWLALIFIGMGFVFAYLYPQYALKKV